MTTSAIVFLGPSFDRIDARRYLPDGDFRPPVRRGDIEAIAAGRVVAIIDGVFHQDLAVSPAEIDAALGRGVRVLGSASMGALRAAEVPGMEAVGRIAQMFRDGELVDDDEVALAFDPTTGRALSEPMVNVRYAVDRLVHGGTLDGAIGRRIVESAKKLFYPERIYPRILRDAGLDARRDLPSLIAMLRSFDLKREDAMTLLEYLPRLGPKPVVVQERRAATFGPDTRDHLSEIAAPDRTTALDPMLLWEYGERIELAELVRFLKLTGRFAAHARRTLRRGWLDADALASASDAGFVPEHRAAALLEELRRRWGWVAAEESRVTLNDLGIGTDDLWRTVVDEIAAEAQVMAVARASPPAFLEALRVELLLADLELKRELIRCGSVRWLAARATREPATAKELEASHAALCERLDASTWHVALEELAHWGVSREEAEAFAAEVALAARTVQRSPAPTARVAVHHPLGLPARAPKVKGSARFTVTYARAELLARRLARVVGITRIGMIGGLDRMRIPVAQAYRPSGVWSSTVGSGKGETAAAARIGAVMEEVEKWAQERYASTADPTVRTASYVEIARRGPCIDPRSLDLPYDSRYDERLPIGWRQCVDLMERRPVWLPAAAIDGHRVPNDIYYSPRRGVKVFSTNGLASGFGVAETLTHALCEVIERDAMKLAEVWTGNPGISDRVPLDLEVDLTTAPTTIQRLLRHIVRGGYDVRALDVTSDVGVPTFFALIGRDEPSGHRHFGAGRINHAGHACHPDPATALRGALLEAVQSAAGMAAGAREDYTLFARSLGRHERTVALTRAAYAFFRGRRRPARPFSSVRGHDSRDAADDVRWILGRLRGIGVRHVVAMDYGVPELAPARVVRVVIPDLETNNPYHSGPRVRGALLADLLPR